MTIAQQLKIKDFPFELKDSKGNQIYFENSDGYWFKCEYNSNGNLIYYEDSDGYWAKCEVDSNGKETYFENSNGYWKKSKFDSKGNLIYYETSNGTIIDNRPKTELTLDQIAEKFGIPVSQLKIKK